MKKLKIYLDTSVISYLYTEDVPDLVKITKIFFEDFVEKDKYLVYISDVVIREINKTEDPVLKTNLLGVIDKYNLKSLLRNDEDIQLAKLYVRKRIIPQKK